MKEQAAELGRNITAVFNMRHKLGIKLKSTWDKKETDKLVKLVRKGLTQREIAVKLGRKPGSVQGKIQQLREKGKI